MLAINVCPGFALADTPDTGSSFSVVYQPASVDTERLSSLSQRLREAASRAIDADSPEQEW